MMLDNLVLYEKQFHIKVNTPNDPLYYLFDYDERASTVNMEFQHFHQFYELCVFLDQSADHLIEGDIYDLQFLDIVALRPLILHKTQYPKGSPRKRLIINFSFPTDIAGLTSDFEALYDIFRRPIPIYRFEGNIKNQLFHVLNDIYKIGKSQTPINTLLIHNKLIEFLTVIYLNQEQNSYTVHSSDNSLRNKIYSVTAYIHEHFSEVLSLELLSSRFYISSYYLSHQFKKCTGFTLNNYIQMTRIRNAQQQLLFSNHKITVISDLCGFSSFSQFNRTFHKHCGMSPSEFRKNNGTGTMPSFT
ncbi:MAG TPA: AraC family transcriptional regulator [Mobilitalea sp.]|nr:AraC family transcriptional regulator [Mobilitalea sp.]